MASVKTNDLLESSLSKKLKVIPFFIYLSDSAVSLASYCRLRNEISDNTFSYTLGAGGVASGSIRVF
jgi:hypothetical protein